MPYAENPYPTAGAAGRKTYEGLVVTLLENTLTHPTHSDGLVDKGDPVYSGALVGVAMESAAAATDYIPVDIGGIYDLSVVGANDNGNVAVAQGDVLYLQSDGVVNKKAGGIPFGVALGAVSSSATTVIAVRLGVPDLTETLAANGVASIYGETLLNGTSAGVAATLANGTKSGQIKIFRCTNSTNAVTVTVAQHKTSDPEVFTFSAGQGLALMWDGLDWITIGGNAAV